MIEKKVKKENDEGAMVMVEKEEASVENQSDVLFGVSHGYGKYVLNILVLVLAMKWVSSVMSMKICMPRTSSGQCLLEKRRRRSI